MTQPKQVVIVGGGLSGLALGYRLRQRLPQVSLTILEKKSRPGGNIWTERRDGFQMETGPNGFLDAKPTTFRLCQDLGIADQLIAASEGSRKNRYLFWKGKLRALPNSLWSFITSDLMSVRGKINLMLESYRKRPAHLQGDESVAAFARRRAGREAAEIFADAMVTGIHAGDPERLSIQAAFPRVAGFERDVGSVFKGMTQAAKKRKREALARGEAPPPAGRMWSFPGGLRVLIEKLQESLGDSLQTGSTIQTISALKSATESESSPPRWQIQTTEGKTYQADALILTCPAPQQAEMLQSYAPDLAEKVRQIVYNRVVVAILGFRKVDIPPQNLDGFGFIAPQSTKRDLLGVQWCSSIFPQRAPEGMVLWRALCGGVHRGEMLDWDNAQVIQAVREELRQSMGVTAEPVISEVVRWPQAIPQYHLGHIDRVQEIEARTSQHPGLYLGGNAYHGVAMNDCTEQAELLTEKVQTYLK